MAEDLGAVDVSGTAEERTWRTTIETPVAGSADPANEYHFVVHREIVVKDVSDNVIYVTRDIEKAVALGFPKFKPERKYTAGEALANNPNIITDIVTSIETLITTEKASE